MTKSEFLEGLRRALSSSGSESLIRENMDYYNSYINEEEAKGRSEAEIIEELGDPALIARSIKAAAGIDDTLEGNEEEKHGYKGYEETKQTYTDDYGNRMDNERNFKSFSINKTGMAAVIIALIIIIIAAVSIVFYIVGGILSFLAPVLGPILMLVAILFFIRIFRGRD